MKRGRTASSKELKGGKGWGGDEGRSAARRGRLSAGRESVLGRRGAATRGTDGVAYTAEE